MTDPSDEIAFEDGPPLHGPWLPSEWELRAAGYQVYWSYDEDGAVPFDAPNLDAWRPPFPDELDAKDGWLLASREFQPIPIGVDYDDDGTEIVSLVQHVPAAMWVRRGTGQAPRPGRAP